MNDLLRLLVVLSFASSGAALVGVISIAIDAPRILPGMVISFALLGINGAFIAFPPKAGVS